MTFGTKSELARHWKLDPRNSIFKKIKTANYRLAGTKLIPLYPIDSSLTLTLQQPEELLARAFTQ